LSPITCSGGSRGVSGVSTQTPFEILGKPPDDLMEDALKLKFLEGSATPLFRSQGTSFQVRGFIYLLMLYRTAVQITHTNNIIKITRIKYYSPDGLS